MNTTNFKEMPLPPEGKHGWPWLNVNLDLPSNSNNLNYKWPKITIVTPNYNYGHFLEATIRSVLLQGYPNLEYIIIDGGSTDNSLEIIKKYERWLTYWETSRDESHFDATNKGFSKSSGEIMAWLSSDDMYFPWTFRTVATIMSELPQIEWLTSLLPGFWNESGFCSDVGRVSGYSQEASLDTLSAIQQESTFWKRSLWQKIGCAINTQYKLAADYDLWLRFFRYSDLYGVSSPLAGFRSHKGQKTDIQMGRFLDECKESLAKMRKETHWQPNFLRKFFAFSRLDKVVLVGKILKLAFGYKGKKVVIKNTNSPQDHWGIEEYKFLSR